MKRCGIAIVVAGILLLTGLPSGGYAASPAPAAAATVANPPVPLAVVNELGALLVEAVPMGWFMDQLAARNPTWPLEAKASRVSADQLACMRSEMSSAGWRRLKFSQARDYAAQNPGRIAGDLRILTHGVVAVTSRMGRAVLQAKLDGTQVDPKAALAAVTAKQMRAFESFYRDPEYAPLRDLVGMDFGGNAGSQDNPHAGYAKGRAMMLDFMLHSMDDCKIPPATLM